MTTPATDIVIRAMERESRPMRKTEQMHRGRISVSAAHYFVTFVTEGRTLWLDHPRARDGLIAELKEWHDNRDGAVLAASIMPDHVHVLFELSDGLTVGQSVGRWKSKTRKNAGFVGDFQRDFWEHRLRDSESIDDYALYIFLNPYRAGLLPACEVWPGWWSPELALFGFGGLLASTGGPPQEWIDWPAERFAELAHGE